jgi:hypothetical protein
VLENFLAGDGLRYEPGLLVAGSNDHRTHVWLD